MRWYKVNSDTSDRTTIINDNKKYKIYTNGSLGILSIQDNDVGTYRVEISNNVGKAAEEVDVQLIKQAG